jgi:hypothetical protein
MEVVTPCGPEVLAYDVPLMERVMWSSFSKPVKETEIYK